MPDNDTPRPWENTDSGVILHAVAPQDLGTAEITPKGRFDAGSYASFDLVYTAGPYGIDDSGSLRVCFRFASDQSNPQFEAPRGANFCTVEASNGAVLQLRWDPKGNVRPWDKTLWIKVVQGYLAEGDTITIRFGVTEDGGPGMRLQTFCEDTFEFRVLSDPIATFNFQPLPEQPMIEIGPGAPERFLAVLPTKRRPGETFSLKVKGEDKWGNPSDRCDQTLKVVAEGNIVGLPDTITLRPGVRAFEFDGLSVARAGRVSIDLQDESGGIVARSNPLMIEDTNLVHYWADLHGQSEETIGTGSAEQYFAFARDLAFVDACGHQGNDFQITDAFWGELNRITATYDVPGTFLALPGYEWSGNTALGGDRNVYFPNENRVIRRSSHALIEGGDAAGTDALTAGQLFDDLAEAGEWDVVMYAHCGGRYADIEVAHDGRFERSVEVHSSWGTFEWLLYDAFRLGYRVGVVSNSDGHKGRPGASYPGAGKFGAIGGLTCFEVENLTRENLLDCMRSRRHYGTTGGANGRMFIDLDAEFDAAATVYTDDPNVFEQAKGTQATAAKMGDIVHLPSGEMQLSGSVETTSPIERVEVFNGERLVHTSRPFSSPELGNRIRVLWEGAEYRGRFRQVIWDGTAKIMGNEVVDAQPVNFLNHDKTLEREGNALSWEALTTGNFGGVDIQLADASAGRLSINTPLIDFDIPIGDIGEDDLFFDETGRLPRFIRVFRLPDTLTCTSHRFSVAVDLSATGDNPIYVRLTQEDGTRAWTSPVYVYR
ncbi:MAG: hypothetical protein ABJ263_16525 [Tateyamaria sp.]|uniref:hypothetical protein n=1 Tax=Tateyamaria sp. TaxID=1929288 RepID=UPI00327E9ED3